MEEAFPAPGVNPGWMLAHPADESRCHTEGRRWVFPHSEIPGSKLVRSSPRLIAAYHVLHRLSAPRHPPDALKALDRSRDPWPLPTVGRSDERGTCQDQLVTKRPVMRVLSERITVCLPNMTGGQQLSLPHRHTFPLTMSDSFAPTADPHRRTWRRANWNSDWLLDTPPVPTMQRCGEWWKTDGSNRRPHACKARALPTELCPRRCQLQSGGGACTRSWWGLGTTRTSDLTLSGVRSNPPDLGPSWSTEYRQPTLVSRAAPLVRMRKRNEDGDVPPMGPDWTLYLMTRTRSGPAEPIILQPASLERR